MILKISKFSTMVGLIQCVKSQRVYCCKTTFSMDAYITLKLQSNTTERSLTVTMVIYCLYRPVLYDGNMVSQINTVTPSLKYNCAWEIHWCCFNASWCNSFPTNFPVVKYRKDYKEWTQRHPHTSTPLINNLKHYPHLTYWDLFARQQDIR